MELIMRRAIYGLLVLVVCNNAFAAKQWLSGNVERVLIESENFGGCMVFSDSFNPSIDCPEKWVSLDCQGNHLEKADARRMFEAAQLSYALEKEIEILVTDEYKNNGYCTPLRVVNKP